MDPQGLQGLLVLRLHGVPGVREVHNRWVFHHFTVFYYVTIYLHELAYYYLLLKFKVQKVSSPTFLLKLSDSSKYMFII